jgi:hypothetical protein
MRWRHKARIPVLTAWAVFLAVVAYLGTHPRATAPYLSGLVSRHLLRLDDGALRVRDFRVWGLDGLDLYGVSLTMPGKGGGQVVVTADTVEVDYRTREVNTKAPRLRRVVLRRPQVLVRTTADSGAVRKPAATPTMPKLPAITIDDLVITLGYLEIDDAGGRTLERIPYLSWRGPVQTGPVTHAVMNNCAIDWLTHASRLDSLVGDLTLDEHGAQVRGVRGLLNGHPVTVDGKRGWDKTMDLAVGARGVNVLEIEHLVRLRLGFKAQGDVDATLRANADTLVYQGVFTGVLEGYDITAMSCRAIVGKRDVWLEDLAGDVNGATFSGRGHFDISTPDAVTFVLEGDATGVNLANGLVPGEEDLPQTSGYGRLRIEHTDKPMWTRVTGLMQDGHVELMPYESCDIDVEATPKGVLFNRVDLRHRDLRAELTGAADSLHVFQGNLSFTSDDLGTLPEGWGWPKLKGRAGGQATLAGPLDQLGVHGRVSALALELGPAKVGFAVADLVIEDVLGLPRITAAAAGDSLRMGGVPLGVFRAAGSVDQAGASLDSFLCTHGDTTGLLRFKVAFSDSIARYVVDEFRVDMEGTRWALDRPLGIGVGEGYLSLRDLSLSSDQGAVSGGGVFDRRHLVAGALQLRRFDLSLLNPFVKVREPLTGRLTADVVLGGEPDEPQITMTADLVEAPFDIARVDSMHVSAVYSRGAIDIQGLDLRTQYGRLQASGTVSNPGARLKDYWTGAALDVSLEIPDSDWSFMEQFKLPSLKRLYGRFGGKVRVTGTTNDPQVDGTLTSAPFSLQWLHLDELAGTVHADRHQMVLGDLQGRQDKLTMTGRLEVPILLDFLSEPTSPMDGPFLLEVDIPPGSDLSGLVAGTNAFAACSGTGEGHVRVSGPLSHPLYQGSAKVRGAGFVIKHLEEVYSDADVDATFDGDIVRLTSIRGREGLSGTLSGDGTLTFNGLTMKTFDIRLALDRFLVASIPDLRALVSAKNGHITGVKVGPDSLLVPRFSGDLEVIRARYTGNFAETPGAVDPRMATVAPDWLADLRLHAAPRVGHIVNREMELDFGGDLDLIRTEEGLHLRGSLDVNRGSLIVFNNAFEVQRGRLDFSRELGFDPRLDIDAQTRYRLRNATTGTTRIETLGVHVAGTLAQPEVEFSSERGYSREAIQRMLLGLDPESQGQPGGDTSRLAASSIAAGMNLVEREIAQELQIFDTFDIDQIQRANDTTGAMGFDPLIGVGKYIGQDLYLKYAQGVRQDDRDVLLEYQINQHLLLQSELRRRIDENQGDATYNLDLKYRFEY